jgi:hypothetical protein
MRERWLAGAVVVPFVLGIASAPSHPGDEVFRFRDPQIVESSGLALSDGLVVTTNDSGDTGRIFAVDPASGRTVGVTGWSADPTDVEALAPAGDGAVWVGDIGDNTASRDAVQVARVPVGRGERTVRPTTYDLTWPDGPENAESLLAQPTTGRLFLVSKDVFGGALYAAPRHLSADRPNRLRRVGPVLPIATDAAFLPDGRHLVVRDYARAAVYSFPALAQVGSFRLPDQQQGEGVAVEPDGSLLVSSEGRHAPVLRVALPERVRRALGPAAASPSAGSPGASASAESPTVRVPAQTGETRRSAWPWLLTGGLALGGLAVLLRSLRPR